jgi:arylsulfatase A-like enzyme
MGRKIFIGGAVIAVAATAVTGILLSSTPRAVPKPLQILNEDGRFICQGCNLILFSLDTLRADRLGVYGYNRATSPNIDVFARESVVFLDTLAQAATTAPSHRSLFTGRYVHEHGNKTDGMPVLASLLHSAGYETAAFVDGGQLRPKFGFQAGFEEYYDTGNAHKAGAAVGGGLREINPRVLDWLKRDRSEPFFLFVHTYDVHCPYTPPEPYFSMFVSRSYKPHFEVAGKCGAKAFNKMRLGDPDFEYISALYDGGVRYTDQMIQSLFDALRGHRLLERSIVIVTSDHGESLGERQRIGHNEVYDVQLKVPLIIRLPGGQAARVETPVQLIDILPTVLSLLNLPRSGLSLGGRDLSPSFFAPSDNGQRLRAAHTTDGLQATVRTDQSWSLMMRGGKGNALYNLELDPYEEHNVLTEHPERVLKLTTAYERLLDPARELPTFPDNLDKKEVQQLEALGYIEY